MYGFAHNNIAGLRRWPTRGRIRQENLSAVSRVHKDIYPRDSAGSSLIKGGINRAIFVLQHRLISAGTVNYGAAVNSTKEYPFVYIKSPANPHVTRGLGASYVFIVVPVHIISVSIHRVGKYKLNIHKGFLIMVTKLTPPTATASTPDKLCLFHYL